MTDQSPPGRISRPNPITGTRTESVLFGFLDPDLGLVFAMDRQGRPDEKQTIGTYHAGTGTIRQPLGQMDEEAVLIKGQIHPICAGQTDKNTGRRKRGVVLIDMTKREDRG